MATQIYPSAQPSWHAAGMTSADNGAQSTFDSLYADARDSSGKARTEACLVLVDFCESVGASFASTARGWARNPYGAYINYTPCALSVACGTRLK